MVQAAQIAGIQPALLRMWFKRGVIVAGTSDRRAAEPGDSSDLSPHAVLAIAITAALARAHLPLDRAAKAATLFAHTNSGRPRRRHPGALYRAPGPAIQTLIVVPVEARPVIMPSTAITDLLVHIQSPGATIIAIDDVVDHVEAELATITGANSRPRRPA